MQTEGAEDKGHQISADEVGLCKWLRAQVSDAILLVEVVFLGVLDVSVRPSSSVHSDDKCKPNHAWQTPGASNQQAQSKAWQIDCNERPN